MTHQPPHVVPLTVTDLHSRFEAGEALVLLDVREAVERAHCVIGASAATVDLHVPMGEIPPRLEELRSRVAALPLVVYCHHGVRSMAVAEWLARQGLARVFNLEGGIDAWSRRVDPSVPRY